MPELSRFLGRFIKKANYIKDYKIEITFDNNKTKIVDLKDHLTGEVFKPLKDIVYFRNFKVDEELDTIVWENGADIAPEFLYEIGK